MLTNTQEDLQERLDALSRQVDGSSRCVITGQIMAEPVVAPDGRTYEREAIEKWRDDKGVSPIDRSDLRGKSLRPNKSKKGEIDEYLAANPNLYGEDEVYLPQSWKRQLFGAIRDLDLTLVETLLARDGRLLVLFFEETITELGEPYTAFHLACELGSAEIVEKILHLLRTKGELSKLAPAPTGFKPIILMRLLAQYLADKDYDKAEKLLDAGKVLDYPVDILGNSLLHRFSADGDTATVSWLLEKGCEVNSINKEKKTALFVAVECANEPAAAILLEHNADKQIADKNGKTVVHCAFEQSFLAEEKGGSKTEAFRTIIKLLVGEEKALLPPLHLALILKDFLFFQYLLTQGQLERNVKVLNPEGQTLLYAAVELQFEQAVDLLLTKKADPHVPCGKLGRTALHAAVEKDSVKILTSLFLSDFIRVDVVDKRKQTALHLAAFLGHEDAVDSLLNIGANFELLDDNEDTPADLARRANRPGLARRIEKQGRSIYADKTNRLIKTCQEQAKRIENLERKLNALSKKVGDLEKENAHLKTKQEVSATEKQVATSPRNLLILSSSQRSNSLSTLSNATKRPAGIVDGALMDNFLQLVGSGKVQQTETLVIQNPELSDATGNFTNLANQTFNDITGFQYAFWSLDWRMWTMLAKHLTPENLRAQVVRMKNGSWVEQHGEYASWKSLLVIQDKVIDFAEKRKWKKAFECWEKGSKEQQALLPVHVVNEFCHPARSFHPCPDFTSSEPLPQMRMTDCGEWYEALKNPRQKGGFIRYSYAMPTGLPSLRIDLVEIFKADRAALGKLLEVRLEQRAEFLNDTLRERPRSRSVDVFR